MLHSARFFYRQCDSGLQAGRAMRKPAMVIPMKIELSKQMNRTILRAVMALAAVLLAADVATSAQDALPPVVAPHKLEIERTARPWEFLTSVGKRAGLFGNESGQIEAWVYPLKILRDLQLTILTEIAKFRRRVWFER